MNRWRSIFGSVVVVGIAGCASTASTSVMDAAVQAQLRLDTQAVANAAATHNVAQLQLAVAALNRDAVAAHSAGKLTDTKLAGIGSAIAAIERVVSVSTSVKPSPTLSTTPPPAGHPKKGGGGHSGGGNGDGGD